MRAKSNIKTGDSHENLEEKEDPKVRKVQKKEELVKPRWFYRHLLCKDHDFETRFTYDRNRLLEFPSQLSGQAAFCSLYCVKWVPVYRY